MAIPSNTDIRLRIEAILETIPDIETVIIDQSCAPTDDELPAVLVLVRQAQRARTNQSWWTVTRTVQIDAFFTRLCDGSVEEQREQLSAAEDFLEVIPDAFERLDRLALSGGTPARLAVTDVGRMSDTGLSTVIWGEDVYYGTSYEFTITTQRN